MEVGGEPQKIIEGRNKGQSKHRGRAAGRQREGEEIITPKSLFRYKG